MPPPETHKELSAKEKSQLKTWIQAGAKYESHWSFQQVEQPSVPHPKLLDWLARDFADNGWDVKRLIKKIVLSETYQQSSAVTAKQLKLDPSNRYLSRGPRFRLAGEFLRDQALAISGLLNSQMGGPGVKPYQPEGLWNEVSLDKNVRFKVDGGDKLYRRSLYTYWKRSAPPPNMFLFDAPTREKCTDCFQLANGQQIRNWTSPKSPLGA